MFAIRKMIVSGPRWLFAVCLLSLCLTNPAVRADDVALPSIGDLIDPPDILFPKPPPPPPPPPLCRATTAMEQRA